MADSIVLSKSNPLLPAEDYNAMRAEGFKAIERLGSDIWTNYNNSDPGITILEAVTYAITDLAYRTGFEVKDLLAPKQLTPDTWRQIFYTAKQILHNDPLTIDDYRKLIIDVPGVRNAWIEPSKDYEVPVWVDYNRWDVRFDADCACEDPSEIECLGKLRLDPVMQGDPKIAAEFTATKVAVQQRIDAIGTTITALNAKLDALKKQNPDATNPDGTPIPTQEMLDLEKRIAALVARQKSIQNILAAHTAPANLDSKIVEFEGLYTVMVEYEEDVLDEHSRESVRQLVIERLTRHRNLCEDFLSIDAVEYEDFGISASIELEEDADPDVVLAQIFFEIYRYFTPSVPFHTIDEMLAAGYLVDEIFEGPALEHGFIDTDELEATALFRDIRLSDLISAISDIPGIKGILYFILPYAVFDDLTKSRFYFKQWVKQLKDERKIARVVPPKSPILFCKQREFISYFVGRPEDRRPDRMLKYFADLKTSERARKLRGYADDFPVPAGEYMELSDYYPVTYSLPMCYGVSDRAGLPANADVLRKAQALQLRGYLLFFEQLLFGYLVQLDRVRDLFTFDPTPKHTYFTDVVHQLRGLQELLIDHPSPASDTIDGVSKSFVHILQTLVESPEIFAARRNQFLDHMLARFGEDVSEYEAIMRSLWPQGVDSRLIEDKSKILRDGEYYRMSTERGKGYNYASPQTWDTGNVSGAERRVARLLGFATPRRHSLVPEFVVITDAPADTTPSRTPAPGAPAPVKKQVLIVDPRDNKQVLLTSEPALDGCCTELLITDILTHAADKKYFAFRQDTKQKSRVTAGLVGTFWFELYNGPDPMNNDLLATSPKYNKLEKRDAAFAKLEQIMHAVDTNEGMHLVEHILLRPKLDEVVSEDGVPIDVSLLDICLDDCDIGIGLGEGTDVPTYRKRVRRIPAKLCYGLPPWQLEYVRLNPATNAFDESILFQEVPTDGSPLVNLRFSRYEELVARVRDIQEFGSERINYQIVSNGVEDPTKTKYGFLILGTHGVVLAQSLYLFHKKPSGTDPDPRNEIETAIAELMKYLEFELDLYCNDNPCDNDEDPYSFRTTAVLPCWPERFRDPTFRNLVEKTIRAEAPAHVDVRIRWVGVMEMTRFETAYQVWLKEMATTEMPSYEAVNPFVDVLNTLRPCGVCVDECD